MGDNKENSPDKNPEASACVAVVGKTFKKKDGSSDARFKVVKHLGKKIHGDEGNARGVTKETLEIVRDNPPLMFWIGSSDFFSQYEIET
jgi:hypothetical protein